MLPNPSANKKSVTKRKKKITVKSFYVWKFKNTQVSKINHMETRKYFQLYNNENIIYESL